MKHPARGEAIVRGSPRTLTRRDHAARHLSSYGLFYLLVAAHLAPEPVCTAAIVLASVLLGAYVVLSRELDLFKIFLLMLPAVGFDTAGENREASSFFEHLKMARDHVPLGPIAVAQPLALMVGFLGRAARRPSILKRPSVWAWILALLLAALGLIEAATSGEQSAAGITVGLRSVLCLAPLLVECGSRPGAQLHAQLRSVVTFTLVLMAFGLLRNHWTFVAWGLLPYFAFVHGFRNALLGAAAIVAFNFFAGVTVTFTLVLTAAVSTIGVALLRPGANFGKRLKVATLAAVTLPFVITAGVLASEARNEQGAGTINLENARFKIFADRKPLWDAAFEQIKESPKMVVPAGRPLMHRSVILGTVVVWEFGAHNMLLESARQVGLLTSLICFSLISGCFIWLAWRVTEPSDAALLWALCSVYLVFGTTGNSLVSSGTGVLFWLLCGFLVQKVAMQPRPLRVRKEKR